MEIKLKKAGFTLVELLIVIVIIGILAVAFLPSVLSAPGKSRDTTRISDVQRVEKVLIKGNLVGTSYPVGELCVGALPAFGAYSTEFSGAIPTDPRDTNVTLTCTGQYYYKSNPSGANTASGTYDFVIATHLERIDEANTNCNTVAQGEITAPDEGDEATWCYAVFSN